MINDPTRYGCDRWRRPGHDRLYVTDLRVSDVASQSYRIGYRDLLTGVDHPTRPQDLAALVAAADRWEVRRVEPTPFDRARGTRTRLTRSA